MDRGIMTPHTMLSLIRIQENIY